MAEPTERHYNIARLNKWFALSSLLFAASFVAMFAEDYNREWKSHQREFRRRETRQTEAAYTAERTRVEQSPEYQELQKQIESARAGVAAKQDELAAAGKDLRKAEAQSYLANQHYQFAKADLDAARYAYEAALARGAADREALGARYEQLAEKSEGYRRAAEAAEARVKEQEERLDTIVGEQKELEKKQLALRRDGDILHRRLQKLDPAHMSWPNRMADAVRDLPIMDAFAPSLKIDQVVAHGITDDVVFTRVPKVDRCTSCHVGILKPGFEDAEQPYRTHPNLELFLSSQSPHPVEEFGCTSCHGGRGRGTDFVSAVHMPSTPEQRKEWEEKYHWHQLHHWERPMFPLKYVEAGCFQCHSGQTVIPGADRLNLGLNLIEKAGCYSCHNIDKYKGRSRPGPSLVHLASKSDRDWVYRWIEDPKSFRHNTWMPQFFHQFNNSDEASVRRTRQEIHAITHVLFARSEEFKLDPMPVKGRPARGEELVASVGCFGCHQIEREPSGELISLNSLRREHGPNLIGLGSKTTPEWIYNWLKNPPRYHPATRMPDLRLTDQEAADIAAFLAGDRHDEFQARAVPPVEEAEVDDIVLGFLRAMNPEAEARERLGAMKLDEKLDLAGTKLIRQYGCFSCHEIRGYESDKPIGTDLTEEGSKPVHQLDFGFIDLDHVNYAWFDQKLRNPRIFDRDRIKPPTDKLRMPNFHFTDQEVDALVTALLGFVTPDPLNKKKAPRTPERMYVEAGQVLVREFNCQGCHLLEGDGGAIQKTIAEWLVRYQDKTEAEAASQAESFSPPNLVGEGQKVRSDWLFDFLHRPSTIRPWLTVRMPTFGFDAGALNTLVAYFSHLDREPFPFTAPVEVTADRDEMAQAAKLFSDEYFSCGSCHIVGEQLPGGSAENWAPNFALAKHRLKPDWIVKWIINPQAMLPGTKMPTFYDPDYFNDMGPEDILDGDEHRQIRALRDYILSIPDAGPPAPPAAKPSAATAPAGGPSS
jgi:mono/diheme cytochrome c family protein